MSSSLEAICANVLQRDLTAEDNARSFLALGGDSLLAIKVLAQCRSQGITINIADIMSAPTLQSLYDLVPGASDTDTSNTTHDDSMSSDSEASMPSTEVGSVYMDDLAHDIEEKLLALAVSSNSHIQAVFPCSAIQERIIVSQVQNPHLYSCSFVLKFTHLHSGLPVSAKQIEEAWSEVVKRHSSLRTVLVESTQRPGHHNQVILDDIIPDVKMYEGLAHLASPAFDVRRPVTFQSHYVPHRVQLVQASQSEVWMKLEISHLLVDGQSAEVLLRDLSDAYHGHKLSAAPLSYGEYVSSYLQGALHSTTNSKKDEGVTPDVAPLMIEMDCPNEELSGFGTVSRNIHLSSQLVQAACARNSVTLATVCQLAWGLVLRCYGGADNVCFSYVNSGRSMSIPGVHDVIGPIVQTSLCSIQLTAADSVSDVLQKLHKDSLQALSAVSPLESTGATSKSARQLSNTTMSFQRAVDDRPVQRANLSVVIEAKANPTDYDISLDISSTPEGLSISLDFWRSRLADERAETILGAFESAIRAIIDDQNAKISDISLLGADDVRQLAQWNSAIPKPRRICLHEKVLEISKLQPSATAINSWDGDLTYAELTAQASTLAHHLQKSLRVSSEKFVGICIDKSKWAIISMLAVLMAGGIVVPLGVSHPRARVKALLTDTRAVALLVDSKHSERLANLELEHTRSLTVDQRLFDSLPSLTEPPVSSVTPDNAAWVIYTSGSTGMPKGVVLLHQNISTSIIAHGAAFGTNCNTRAAQFAAFTFDVSLSDIFMTLFHGGCVCVLSEDSRMNSLQATLKTLAVNYVNLTPTVLGLLDPAELPDIRTVVAGGEALNPAIVEKWSPHARVFNSVGPSECTIIAVASGPLTDPTQAANVGYPTGTRLWVTLPTDPNQLCPVGVPGELLIEGPMLSRGYLNDAEKTAAAFIENPSFIKYLQARDSVWKSQFQGSTHRIYRSGDLVRQLKDGSLVHMGRRDTQVKIRGQRVEIGEIEYWITQCLKNVRRVAVLVVERGRGKEQKSLVAAVEFAEHSDFSEQSDLNQEKISEDSSAPRLLPCTASLSGVLNELRTALMEHLPPYMSPSIYAPVTQLPLNPSGKIDRRAVAHFINEQDDSQLQQYLAVGKHFKEPSTETEYKLQALWANILGIDASQISADGHFFHVGGDSVAAMRVVAAAQDVELDLRVADIFEHPSLFDLARVVENRILAEVDDEAPAPLSIWREALHIEIGEEDNRISQIAQFCGLETQLIEDILPCTALQEGLIALTAQQPTAYIDRQVFDLAATVDIPRFKSAWETTINETSTLRTRIVSSPEFGTLQVISKPGEVDWHQSSCLDEYLESDRQAGMGIGLPLNRFALISEPHGRQYFVWTAHHSTYDGWSRGLVLQKTADIYLGQAFAQTTPFSHFIKYIQSPQLQSGTVSYWREQLGGAASAEFPAAPSANYQPRPKHRHRHNIHLGQRGTSTEIMLPDLLRGAWALVVHPHVGKIDPIFAVALSGRNAPVRNVTSIAGPTLTTVPVRIFIDPEQNVENFLQSVREQAVKMIPYEHTGLQRIKKMLPDLASAVDLKHLFVVQPANDDERRFKIPGVRDHVVAVDEFDSYGLNVECTLSGGSVKIDFRFDAKMMTPAQVMRLASQFESIVHQLRSEANATLKIKDIDVLSGEDINQLKHWNSEPLPSPLRETLHGLIASVALSQPQATAIESWDGRLTYEQLDSFATVLSQHLNDLGVGPEIAVPVCMDKSMWAMVSFLAVLRAGGVVVPLGVDHPLPRISSILADTKAKVILVDSHQASRLEPLISSHALTSFLINSESLGALPLSSSASRVAVTPDNAAWIVFTSGSTGQPKGVVLTHSSLSTAVKIHGARFGLGSQTRTIQFATHTFDAVIQDYFTTLISGGTVCVPSEDDRMSNLAGIMREMNVNFANLTSTVARLITPESVPSLKTLVLAGEQIQNSVVETWYKHADVLNVYGPAECSINSTCNGPIVDVADAQSIGHGMGSHIWIANPSNPQQLSAVGTPGEILIQGPGLAREYLGDKTKTDAVFIHNPAFASHIGLSECHLYRTGDMGKQTEDGKILYLGRIDTQIKIHGQRVEVGEIEHWIGHHLPNVKHAAVIAISRGVDSQIRLAAVIEFRNGNKADSGAFGQLKKILGSQLPSYMVPSLYIPVDQVPLTVSGKLDRRAIRDMVENIPKTQLEQHLAGEVIEARLPPSTAMEKTMQRIWANAMGVELDFVGAHDDFFQLGGDSVVAMHVSAMSRQDSSIGSLSVAEIFQHPRLSDLAKFLEEREAREDDNQMELLKDEESPFALLQEALDLGSL
ncbi:non-ribosomal peptide synthetase [Penicillium chermesinum]|uniref:Non-ribosomal peptide synthetase n=1 Tax=Penicillium chermesinum TaxID=63820 RepID=A0A9W9NHY3_9EURO|nr:non-ribosomal peptide synthetase [Penicillium chermesinum]KAJ5220192.1 non-ribosomal peptide synthetase [Penicillium chermesinum]KAJ6157636.1 non-ribosomal peptide synthetase [Penicillium chermesinum]